MALSWITGAITLIFTASPAQGSMDTHVTCQTQAKSAAVLLYKGCMTGSDEKASEVSRLRRQFEERLKSIQDDYERELKELRDRKKSEARMLGRAIQIEDDQDIPEPIPIKLATDLK